MSRLKEIIFISIARGFSAAAFSISIPFLNIYLYSVRGVPMKIIGLLVGTASLLGAFSRIFAGFLGDRLGCKNIMILGLLSRFFAFLFFTIFIVFKVHPLLFLIGFILNSLGFSFFQIGSDSYVGVYLPPKDRPGAFGVIRIGTNLGFALGPAVGGFLSSLSYLLLFSLSSLFSLLVIPLIQFGVICPKIPVLNKSPFLKEIKDIFEDKFFLIYLFSSYLIFTLAGQMISTLSVFAKERGLSNIYIGYLYTINGLSVVFLQILFTKFSEKLGIKRALLTGIFLYILGYFLFSFARNFIDFAIFVFIFTSGEMFTLPLLTTVVTIYAKEEKKSLYIGFLGLFEGLGWASAPVYGGIILDLFIKTPLIMWGIIVIPGIISFIILMKFLNYEKMVK
ncbi:MAG: MFS transporter [candidate division WOR-3 bacterium]